MPHNSCGREKGTENCTSSPWPDDSERSDSHSEVTQGFSKDFLPLLSSSELDEFFSSIAAALTCVLCEKLVGLEERDSSVAVVQSCGHFFCSTCINTCIEKGFEETPAITRARTALHLVKEVVEGGRHDTVSASGRSFHPTVPAKAKKEMPRRTNGQKKRQPRRCFQCPICFGPAMKWMLTTPVPFISHLCGMLTKEMPSLVTYLEKNVQRESQGGPRIHHDTAHGVASKWEIESVEKSGFVLENAAPSTVTVPLLPPASERTRVASPDDGGACVANSAVHRIQVPHPLPPSPAPYPSRPTPSLSSLVSPPPIPSHTVQQTSLLEDASKEWSNPLPQPNGVEYSADLFGFVPETSDPLLCFPPPLPGSFPMLAPLLAGSDSVTPLRPLSPSPPSRFPTLSKADVLSTRREGSARSRSISTLPTFAHSLKRPRSPSSVMSSCSTAPFECNSPLYDQKTRRAPQEDEALVEGREKEMSVASSSSGALEPPMYILLDQSFEDPVLLPTLKQCLEGVWKCTDTNGKDDKKDLAFRPPAVSILIDERWGEDISASPSSPLERVSTPEEVAWGHQGVPHRRTRIMKEAAAENEKWFSPLRISLKETIWPLACASRQYLVFGKWELVPIRAEAWCAILSAQGEAFVSEHLRKALEASSTWWCGGVPALTPMICTALVCSGKRKGVREEVEWYRSYWRVFTCLRAFTDSFSLSLFPFFPLRWEGEGGDGMREGNKKEAVMNAGEEEEEEWWRRRVPIVWKRNGKVQGIPADSCNAFAALLRHALASFSSSPSCVTQWHNALPAAPSTPLRKGPPSPPSPGAWVQEGGYVFFMLPDVWCQEAIAFWCWWQQEKKKEDPHVGTEDESRMTGKSVLGVEEEGEEAGMPSLRHTGATLHTRSIRSPCGSASPSLEFEKGESSAAPKNTSWSRCFSFFQAWGEDREGGEKAKTPSSHTSPIRHTLDGAGSRNASWCRTLGFTHPSWYRLVQTAGGAVIEVSHTLWVTLLVYLTSDPSRVDTRVEEACESCGASTTESSAEEGNHKVFHHAARRLAQELSALVHAASDPLPTPDFSPPAAPQRRELDDGDEEGQRADPQTCTETEERAGFPLDMHLHHFAPENRTENARPSFSPFSLQKSMGDDEEEEESAMLEGPHLLLLHQTLSERFLVECSSLAEESIRRMTTSSLRGSGDEVGAHRQEVHEEGSKRGRRPVSAGDTTQTVGECNVKEEEHEKERAVALSLPPTSILRSLSTHLLTAGAKCLYLLLWLWDPSIFSSRCHTVAVAKEKRAISPAWCVDALSTHAEARTAAWFLTNLAEGRHEAGVKRWTTPSFENPHWHRSPFQWSPSQRHRRGAPWETQSVAASAREKASATPITRSPSLEGETGMATVHTERLSATPEKERVGSSFRVSSEEEGIHQFSLPYHSNRNEMHSAPDDQPSALLHPIFRNLLYEDSP